MAKMTDPLASLVEAIRSDLQHHHSAGLSPHCTERIIEEAVRLMRNRAAELHWEPPTDERRNYWHMNGLKYELETFAAQLDEALRRTKEAN